MLGVVEALRRSPVVKQLQVLDLVDEATAKYLKCRAELLDGSSLHVIESSVFGKNKYSYHCRMHRASSSFAGTMLRIILKSNPFLITVTKAAYYSKARVL